MIILALRDDTFIDWQACCHAFQNSKRSTASNKEHIVLHIAVDDYHTKNDMDMIMYM